LIDPPGSDRDEASWIGEIVRAAGNDLLLDLHNLHANAINFQFDQLVSLSSRRGSHRGDSSGGREVDRR
jgi:uncharacterized protein (UPF0276 family)